MNWWGLVIMWVGAMLACYGTYKLGKTVGHIEGHQCEAFGNALHQLEREANGNE